MQTKNVFREALVGYLETGTSIVSSYTLALIVARTYLSGSLSPGSVAVAEVIRKTIEHLERGGLPDRANIILEPGEDGPLTRIPRPECMEQHLPRNRPPTEDEIRSAWLLCGGFGP